MARRNDAAVTANETTMIRKYHTTEFKIRVNGDMFRINGVEIVLPFSAATQTDACLVPESYNVVGRLVEHLASQGVAVTSRMVLEIGDCVVYYVRTFRNNPAAAKHHVDGTWINA